MKDMLSRGLKGFNNFSIFNDQCTLTVSTTNDGTVPNGVAIGILNISVLAQSESYPATLHSRIIPSIDP